MTNRIQKTLSFDAWEEGALNNLCTKFNLSASAIVRALIKQADKKVKKRSDLENCITAHNVHDVNLEPLEVYQWMVDYFEHKIKNLTTKHFWEHHKEDIHEKITDHLVYLFEEFVDNREIYK